MFLRNDINEVIARTKNFYETESVGNALVMVRSIDSIKLPSVKALNLWYFPEDLHAYLDQCIERLVFYWENRQIINDDHIPAIAPYFGLAEHFSYIGGEAVFTEDTSYPLPFIIDWSDMDDLELREDNVWIRMVIDGMKYLRDKSEGRYAVQLRGAHCPLDLANMLRGNEVFTDFFDFPDELGRLLDFCCKAAGWTLSKQLEAADDFYGGVVNGMGIWLPGRSVGHLSEDTSPLCSPAIYRKFGLPYTTRLLEGFDHIYMHIHPLGSHCLPEIASMSKIDFFDICNDPKCPQGIEIYRKYSESCLKDKIVGVQLSFQDIKDNMEFLKGKKTIIWYEAADLDDANAAVELVRRELSF